MTGAPTIKLVAGVGRRAGIAIDLSARTIRRDGEMFGNQRPGPVLFRVIAGLLCSYPRLIERDDLAEYVWGAGAALRSSNNLSMVLRKAAPYLRWLGFKVVSEWGRGLRLEPIPAERARVA